MPLILPSSPFCKCGANNKNQTISLKQFNESTPRASASKFLNQGIKECKLSLNSFSKPNQTQYITSFARKLKVGVINDLFSRNINTAESKNRTFSRYEKRRSKEEDGKKLQYIFSQMKAQFCQHKLPNNPSRQQRLLFTNNYKTSNCDQVRGNGNNNKLQSDLKEEIKNRQVNFMSTSKGTLSLQP